MATVIIMAGVTLVMADCWSIVNLLRQERQLAQCLVSKGETRLETYSLFLGCVELLLCVLEELLVPGG